MEKKFVTVHIENSRFRMELIQFVVVPDGSILAVCMDEVGDFRTFPLDVVQGEGFEIE